MSKIAIALAITDHGGKPTINARSLHRFLEVQSEFRHWIKNRISDFQFSENQDFTVVGKDLPGQPTDYFLSLDMAKELSMVERSSKGKEARLYFIECEKQLRTTAPQFQLPANMAEALRLAADSIERAEVAETKLIEAGPKLQTYNEVMKSEGSHNFREAAGLLPHLGLGSNNLVKALVAKKVLYYDNEGKIRCYQPYTDSGYFKLIERPYEVKEVGGIGTGEYRVSATLKVTPAGIEFISRKLGGDA